MSLKRIFKALENLGLSQKEAQIYVFLEKNGAQKNRDIAKALKMRTNELIISLKNLQDKKIVRVSAQHIAEFSAVPFKQAIDFLIEVKKEKAQSLQERKVELLASWQSMMKNSENN